MWTAPRRVNLHKIGDSEGSSHREIVNLTASVCFYSVEVGERVSDNAWL